MSDISDHYFFDPEIEEANQRAMMEAIIREHETFADQLLTLIRNQESDERAFIEALLREDMAL